MAITSLARRPADDTTDTTGNIVTSSEVWILHLSTNPSSTVAAYNALDTQSLGFGFPQRGGTHADLTSLLMIEYSVAHHEGQKNIFIVNVSYTNDREESEQLGNDDPLDVPADYDYQQVDRQVVITEDQVTGEAIVNFANSPILGITENVPLTRIVIRRNEGTYNDNEAQTFRNAVNSSPVTIQGDVYDTGTAKLELFAGNLRTDQNGDEYYTITYTVLINLEGFARKIPNRGTKNIFGNPPNSLVRASDGAANLDEDGTFRAPTEQPIISDVNTLKQENWNVLRL